MKKKTQVEEIERTIYDITDKVNAKYIANKGINEKIVREISRIKKEPDWMLELRLKALNKFYEIENPIWGPDLSEVDIEKIVTYISPNTEKYNKWEKLPEDIKNTFDRLGIPKAEKDYLAGVSAQYDSEEVYHNVKEKLNEQGVLYMDMSEAVLKYPEIVKKYFQKAVNMDLHKYSALHYAIWSGGSFVYVPENVKLDIPIQSYYRLNAPGAGQFEHTLIIAKPNAKVHYIEGCSAPKYNVLNIHAGAVEIHVEENAEVKFSTIENWSRNMYNLNTKRAKVYKNGKMEWVSGSFGSRVSMLYPTSELIGDNSKAEFTSITFASSNQYIDNGCANIHIGKNTSSSISTKAIVRGNGISNTRNFVYVRPTAENAKSNSECETLMLSNISRADTIPVMNIQNSSADIGHEAKIGKIDDKTIYYLMTRGISDLDAKAMIVRGFAEPISKSLPIEYAVEMNNLINMELEGTNG